MEVSLNSFPRGKMLDWSKLKASADDKINVNQELKFVLEKVENIARKGENAGFQHFLLSHNIFRRFLFQGR